MSEKERRVLASGGMEVREDNGKKKLVGYAARYNERSVNLGGFTEELAPGAFNRALAEKHDVRALVDHNPTLILGRTAAGTLTLRTDEQGLVAEIDPPDTQAARDIMASVSRGDVSGMSFGFFVREDEWRNENKQAVRIVRDLDLFDISVVTFPAYTQTSVSMRAIEQARETVEPPAPEPPAPPLERLEREIMLLERD